MTEDKIFDRDEEILFLTEKKSRGRNFFPRYDSTHGGLGRDSAVEVSIAEGQLSINGQHVAVYSERDPKNIPWGAAGTQRLFMRSFKNKIKSVFKTAKGQKRLIARPRPVWHE